MRAASYSLVTTRYFTLLTHLTGVVVIVWLASTGILANIGPFKDTVLYSTTSKSVIPFNQQVITQSLFTQKIITTTSTIPYKVNYVNDDNLEFGKTQVLQEGTAGKRISKLKITYYQQKEYAKELAGEEVIEPTSKIVAKGTKKIIRYLDTADGQLAYYGKLSVFATSYDKNCPGCSETTATGMKTGYGVIAVDPKIIPMMTRLYIPGYGVGIAGDTGGAIKGNVIDLGFDDVRSGWWSSRVTDVYLLAE